MSILNTSLSGMMANTNWLSSIAQNVANANTTGYKNVDTAFSTLVDAGVDADSEFAGVTTSVLNLNSLQGQDMATSTTTDMSVQGAGFFIVSDASGDLFLTRNGSFVPDASGNLVNSSGYYLMGTPYGQNSASNALSSLEKINVNNGGTSTIPSTTATMVANLPSTATAVTGSTPASNLGATATSTGSQYTAETSLVAYDDLGAPHTINYYFTKTGPDTWEATAYDASTASATSTNGGFPYSSGPLATQTLTYSATTGALLTGGTMTMTVPSGKTLTVDLSQTTQLASAFAVSSATINGNAPGTVTDVSIAQDGTLSFTYGNGSVTPIYDIPLAKVASPDNMKSVVGDAFQPDEQSGALQLGAAGTGGLGTINSSSLEQSTVDLATELTAMVQAQADYQANSKVFQAGAKLLDILNNLQT
jgi:flagellar hook protein FlgE